MTPKKLHRCVLLLLLPLSLLNIILDCLQEFVITFLSTFGVPKDVATKFATEVIVRKYEDTWIKSAVMSGFGKKMFGYW